MSDPVIPDRFKILEELHHSDGEILLRARDSMLQREVILRRPTPGLAAQWRDREVVDGEMRSARALARVQHPNVVRLLEVIPTDDGPLVAMEPVPGETLAERLARDGVLAPDDVRQLGFALASALEAVHAQSVVHRGISAGSIVIRPDGSPSLGGFVFAKFDARAGTDVPGTTFFYDKKNDKSPAVHALPPHPAPEQVRGQTADARSDLFGLGWVLYEALTGESPYPRDLEPERWDAPRDPRKRAPTCSKALAQAVLRCLATSPMKRYASASELRAALEADMPTTSANQAASPGRKRVLMIAGSLGVIAAVAIGVMLSRSGPTDVHATRDTGGRGTELTLATGELNDTYGKSYALLIGIGKGYEKTGFKELRNSEHDVESIEKKLNSLPTWNGAAVKHIYGAEATKQHIKDALTEIAQATEPNDRVFIYYAGHGEREEGTDSYGYIIPSDARPKDLDESHTSWLSFADSFGLFFQKAHAKHILVAVDSCYGGCAQSTRGLAMKHDEDCSSRLLTRRARVIISSGQKDETVLDGDGDHSPFAQAFMDALSRERPMLTSSMLFNDISAVFAEKYPQQVPDMGPGFLHQDSQFVFFTKSHD